jgi:hypothetical protein
MSGETLRAEWFFAGPGCWTWSVRVKETAETVDYGVAASRADAIDRTLETMDAYRGRASRSSGEGNGYG